MIKNRNITYWIITLPILAIIITSTILTYKFLSFEEKNFEEEIHAIEQEYISEVKTRIESRVDRLVNIIEDSIQLFLEEEKDRLKELVTVSQMSMESIYKKYQHLPKEMIIKKIVHDLENLRFFDDHTGYFFIIDYNNKVLMHSQNQTHVNQDKTNLQDKNGKYLIQEFTNIAKTKKEGFATWSWTKPITKKVEEKIGYIKAFEPLEIYIGTGRYKDDIYKKIKRKIKAILTSIKYGEDEYIFTMDNKGTTITHLNKEFIGKTIADVSEVEKKIIGDILEKAKAENGSFIHYTPTSHNLKEISQKISFVKTIPSLNWIIGTGEYTKRVINKIEKKSSALKKKLNQTTNAIIYISVAISLLLILVMYSISKRIEEKLKFYEEQLKEKNKSLKSLNDNLESRVEEQVLKIRQKDELIHQQSKLASMGEMIGNIAHQWRQPLSAISTAASGIKIHYELDIIDQKTMHQALDAIVNNTQLLSQTIEDFRNFFKRDKEKADFFIKDSVKRALSLISASLKNKEIEIVQEIDDSKIYGLENELTQVILNILNNSKDALLQLESRRLIFIKVKERENDITITIKDTAGGIKEDILSKIFEPYFTTKFNSQGTGIGLYMSQIIIVNHMQGELNASNEEFEYEGEKYRGASFEIVLKK